MTRRDRADIAPENWLPVVADLKREGLVLFDFLTAVDRRADIELVLRLVDPVTRAAATVWTSLPADAPKVATLSGLYLGASWCERETAEMFGVHFIGLADTRPLLLRAALGQPPLRKGSTLVARAIREWPGAAASADDGRQGGNPSRRRQLPPGVPGDFLRDARLAPDAIGGEE